MPNLVGIRQGRLSAPVDAGRPRFPWRSWQDEFARAAACGFNAIEWLFAAEGWQSNPLLSDTGRDELRRQIEATGIQARSVCADYFVTNPFFRVDADARTQSISMLSRLIARSANAGIETVVVPILEESEVRSPGEEAQLLDALARPLDAAAKHGLCVALESELPARLFLELIERARHPALGICYDTGNAAAKGYDVASDVRVLAPHLREVHIKDRTLNGPSVALGSGDADFPAFFSAIAAVAFSGPLILETPAGTDALATAAAHLSFVRERQCDS